MNLYHGTQRKRAEIIKNEGFTAYSDDDTSICRDIKEAGVYGFSCAEDAEDFAIDQCFDGGFEVLSFEVDEKEVVTDTEYDHGQAWFISNANSISNIGII